MSSSRDAGYYSDQQIKIERESCPKDKDGKHKWQIFGSWPSTWRTCTNCKVTTYSK